MLQNFNKRSSIISTNINRGVGVHSSRSGRKKDSFLPLATDVVNPPGMLIRTVRQVVVWHHFMQHLRQSKNGFVI